MNKVVKELLHNYVNKNNLTIFLLTVLKSFDINCIPYIPLSIWKILDLYLEFIHTLYTLYTNLKSSKCMSYMLTII